MARTPEELPGHPISLEEAHLEDVLEDPQPYSPSDIPSQGTLRGYVEQFFAPLSEVQRRVLIMDFGIDTGMEKSRREIGEEIGKSKRAVSRIRERAIAKLRRVGKPEHLRDYLQ